MTTLPTLPTDNLYKFVFIAGLTLVLFGIILYSTQRTAISTKIDASILEMSKLENEWKFFSDDVNELDTLIQDLKLKLDGVDIPDSISFNQHIKEFKINALKDKNYREYLSFLYEHEKDILPFLRERDLIIEKLKEQISKKRQLAINLDLSLLIAKQIKRDNNNLLLLGFFSGGLILIGAALARYGYSKWYTLLQKPSDEKIKLELKQLKEKNL